MKVSGRRRCTIPAARPSRPPPASSCTLHSVWALSHGPRTGSRRAGLGGPALVGICKLFFSFLFH